MAILAPSPGPMERDVLGLVRELFDEAKRAKKRQIVNWNKYYRQVRNKTWSDTRPAWLPSPQASEVFPAIHTLVAWMTDQRPLMFCSPSPSMAEFDQPPSPDLVAQKAQDLRVAMDAWWVVNGCQQALANVLWDAFQFGAGISKQAWDPTKLDGAGDASFSRVDPYTYMVDPNAASHDDARYVLEVRRVPLYEIKARYPERAHLVKADGVSDDESMQRPKQTGIEYIPQANLAATGVTGIFPGTPTPGIPPMYGASAGMRPEDYTRTVLLIEAWIRGSQRLVIPVIEDGTRIDDLEIEAPYWEHAAIAGGVVLTPDTSNPFEHGGLPYVRYPTVEVGEFWGIPLCEHLSPAQIALNRLLAALQTNAELIGNPILLEDSDSGISRTKIVNRPGGRLTKNQGREVKWLDPPSMPPSVMDLIGFWRETIDRISGVSAATRGTNLRRREAAASVDAVQEASFVRIRDTLRQVEEGLRQAGNQVASNICQFYVEPRAIPKLGPQGSTGFLQLGAKHFFYPQTDATGEVEDIPLRFDVWVESGSSLPISRQARQAAALQLQGAGALSTEGLLEAFDWPDRTKELERVKAMQAAAAPPEGG